MTTSADTEHEQLMQEVASRMESSKLSRRPSRSSFSQTPKRRSARIEKPRSNHQSPRGLERRRTLTAVKQCTTLDDHYRKMFGLEDDAEKEQEQHTARPVSWHPSSSQMSGSSNIHSARSSFQWQGHGVEGASLSHRTATPYHQSISHPDGLVGYSHAQPNPSDTPLSVAQYASYVDAAWSSYMHGQVAAECTSWFDGDEPRHSNTVSQHPPNAQEFNSLPIERAPIQEGRNRESGTKDRLVRQKSTELIGLGLYDPPGSMLSPVTSGKGLKLEETWQPPEEMEDADADEESEDEEDEPPRPEDQQYPQSTLPMVNMAGQSFFFEEEDAGLKNEWWYLQLKNPVPQAGAVGYDWLSGVSRL